MPEVHFRLFSTLHAVACEPVQFKEFLPANAKHARKKFEYSIKNIPENHPQSNGGWVVRRTDTTCGVQSTKLISFTYATACHWLSKGLLLQLSPNA